MREAIQGGERSDELKYRTDFVTLLIEGVRVRGDHAKGIANHGVK